MVTLTDSAVSEVKRIIITENDDSLGLRIEVAGGGCSGYRYDMYFDSEQKKDDVVADFGGVRVMVDPVSAGKLEGATLDYTQYLDGGQFSITNPNAPQGCGCGKS